MTAANLCLEAVVMKNKAQLWDFVKCRIRSEPISYSIVKVKERHRKETEFAILLKSLENTGRGQQ